MQEEWREIPGFEGKYAISTHGQVKSLERTGKNNRYISECIRKLTPNNNQYLYVKLWIDQGSTRMKYQKYFIHRLVAMCFIENPLEHPIVNHKDRNRHNNHVSNLEWLDASGNQNHWREHERVGRASSVDEDLTIDDGDLPFD